jgi:lipid A disaccharide synthetase
MVNLIAAEAVVPELVQQDFTTDKVLTKLNEVIADGPARNKMVAGLDGVRTRLQGPTRGPTIDERHAVDRAAEAVLAVWGAVGKP